ncbi:PIN-like domain-containing protein [Streptomyces europaeiscabiei]|uniref:PIN-like domain-containing protein n=1 Tax=Streptomyces europaeiscabiei TaxID=146819 RepID=A0AAJ2PVJ3_9ACTN|nr:PIN-like domain-containing protein [Streptomyces europaeiscabiei]MDX3134033.1 PIN-like domain-containing protein [Streptomyces europaeiscabiei]
MAKNTTSDAENRGLFDDFGAFRTPTAEDFTAVLTRGLVAPDANVLLNLYRYTEQARGDLLRALGDLENRLWVPHQALVEFWRNREGTLSDARSSGAQAAEDMAGHAAQAERTLRTWANRVALPEDETERLRAQLNEVFDDVQETIVKVGEGEWQHITQDTSTDPVIAKLEPALDGRVGAPLSEEDYGKAIAEGMRRVEKRLPPGYMDKTKDGVGAAADYLVWEQILREAARRRCDVLFVTADVKEDWWRKEQGFNRGPRPELTEELRIRGGGRLFMLTPKRFLEVAAPILKFSLQEGSVEDIERVERIGTEETYGGWTAAALQELFDRLTYEGREDRVAVIKYATEMGGVAVAQSVYDICDYPDDRTLRGFTKPVTRITGAMRTAGKVPDSAVTVLEAKYDSGPGPASGFAVHPLLVPLINNLADDEQ